MERDRDSLANCAPFVVIPLRHAGGMNDGIDRLTTMTTILAAVAEGRPESPPLISWREPSPDRIGVEFGQLVGGTPVMLVFLHDDPPRPDFRSGWNLFFQGAGGYWHRLMDVGTADSADHGRGRAALLLALQWQSFGNPAEFKGGPWDGFCVPLEMLTTDAPIVAPTGRYLVSRAKHPDLKMAHLQWDAVRG